jgi:hypothetical protein
MKHSTLDLNLSFFVARNYDADEEHRVMLKALTYAKASTGPRPARGIDIWR